MEDQKPPINHVISLTDDVNPRGLRANPGDRVTFKNVTNGEITLQAEDGLLEGVSSGDQIPIPDKESREFEIKNTGNSNKRYTYDTASLPATPRTGRIRT